ncbi:hypothetical protein BGK67_32590 [Streptomyces subrutilus]|uniref:Uncharacterized protein n=1 Tax=Streptomyces subrutilus TaxID=36818 RepID=A0A1E5NZX9_9ACTN|nr:hypothetical protein BGK67_32590 [Streptomyces subrutilus]
MHGVVCDTSLNEVSKFSFTWDCCGWRLVGMATDWIGDGACKEGSRHTALHIGPEMNFPRSVRPTAGLRTRISVRLMIPVCPLAPRWPMTSARVRSRMPGAMVQPRLPAGTTPRRSPG